MIDTDFRPTLFLKHGCPFCFKARLFLFEAGLTEQVDIRAFAPSTSEEDAVRNALALHLTKVSFPAAELAPGRFVADSDAIIAGLAAGAGIDPAAMQVLSHYVEGPLKQIATLWQQNQELKAAVT